MVAAGPGEGSTTCAACESVFSSVATAAGETLLGAAGYVAGAPAASFTPAARLDKFWSMGVAFTSAAVA